MSMNLQNQPVPDLFELLYERYTQDIQNAGDAPDEPAPIKALLHDRSVVTATAMLEAIQAFKLFCEEFFKQYPPEASSSLSSGFGLRLAGGFEVNLVTTAADAEMQDSGDIPVTVPRSIRHQQGVVPSRSIDITPGK